MTAIGKRREGVSTRGCVCLSLTHTALLVRFCRIDTNSMGLRDAADKAAERAVYEKGGYPALFKFKVIKMYRACCGCCG